MVNSQKLLSNTHLIILFILFSNLPQFLSAQTATLDKAVDLSIAASGEDLVYTLTYGCSSLDADCIGAILIDTLPPEVDFMSATQALVTGNGGTTVISPVYDPIAHTIIWDFRTIAPEAGLPDGVSGTVEILVNIPSGITPEGIMITNNAFLPTDNAGNPEDDAVTVTDGISPMWTIAKSVTSGPIYHDQPVDYEVTVCPDSEIGNLHLLPGATITDNLPDGANFLSASAGGTHDGGTPGSVVWTTGAMDTLKVDEPCRIYTITVEYPAADPNNQTGLATQIPKANEAVLDATAIGGDPVMENDIINDPLLPPVFAAGITKETGNGNGATPVNATNKFILGVSNESTVPVDDFIITDAIPPQANITSIHLEPSMGETVLANIRVQLNESGTWINFQTGISTATESEFDVTTIPGWMPGTSYVSDIEVNFGTVGPGFMGTTEFIFEPAYPTANDGTTTDLDTEYSNDANITYTRPLDGAMFTEMGSTTFCVVDSASARIDPDKAVEINYVQTPAGDPTTGNPYFKGARVKYTLHLGNDGSDGSDDDDEITADSSFAIVSDPIGADLLPAQMLYETSSWTIVNNTSDETWDNSGTNPTFELINDFNGTGKTLLRWTFTGDLEPGEGLDICFNATIRDTVATGRMVENGFAMTSATDIYCDEGACEPPLTNPELNNYFGQSGDPSMLLPGITEMCEELITIEVADTLSSPDPYKTVTSTGPYAPTESAPAELGLARDTAEYSIGFCNTQQANFTLPDPVLLDLLPIELEYIPGSMYLISNTTGIAFASTPTGATNPVLEVIDDFAGTGRQLLRWTFTGEVPINQCVDYGFKTLIKPGSGGLVQNEPFVNPAIRQYECVNGSIADGLDYDGDGDVAEELCQAVNTADIIIPTITSMSAVKSVRGVADPEFLESGGGVLAIGTTFPADTVYYQIRVSNPGNETLTDGTVIDIFPYLDDVGVQLNTTARETDWVPYLVEPVMAATSTIDVYYSQNTNPCRPEISPVDGTGCVDDWTTTPPANLSTVRAVKFDFVNEDIEPGEEFMFDIVMLAPDSITMSPGIAWNSLARNANEVPAQEPNKVGVRIQGYDLALRKTLSSGQNEYVNPLDDVDFTITVINQSSDSVQNVVITDYIPASFTLNDGDWTAGTNTASYQINGPIAPNDSVSIEITLAVSATAQTGDLLDNFAEISDFESLAGLHPTDWDSTPDTDNTNDAGGTINSAADDYTLGNGLGAMPDVDAATDEDDHDGARVIVCPSFTASAADQEVCTDDLAALQDIVVPTTAENTQDIKFTYYTTAQSTPDMYDGTGIDIGTVNPSSGTATLPEANIPTAVGTYYIYAILDPVPADVNCRPFDEIVVTINPPIVANAGMDVDICLGETATLTASATGGNGNYSYLWNTTDVTAAITVSPTTTTMYSVTITDDSNNCQDVAMVTVTVNPLPTVDAGPNQSVCINEVTMVTATGGAGTAPYNYEWSTTETTQTISVMVAEPTTFYVTVTDANMCTALDSVMINVPVANAGMDVTICEGQSSTLTASGGVSYLWSTTETTQSIDVSPVTSTTYSVTVTDVNSCTATDDVLVTLHPLIVADAGMDVDICLGESTTLTAVAGGSSTYSYLWSTTAMTSTIMVSPTVTTMYSVTITDIVTNCEDVAMVTVTVNPLPTVDAGPDQSVCVNEVTMVTATGGSGTAPYSYEWSTTETTQSISVMVAEPTTFYVTVTDANMCTALDSVRINVPVADAGIDVVACEGQNTTLTASGGVSYQWSTGENTQSIEVNPSTMTTYFVTVTDANACTDDDSVIVDIGDCDFPDYQAAGPFPTCPQPPCHTISSDIYLGSGVTPDNAGNEDANADSDVDDGVVFPNNINPGININLQITIFNTTGSTAYLTGWIDWNGDGDFDDTGEMVANEMYNGGSQVVSLPVSVPSNVNNSQPIASRFRISSSAASISSPCGNGSCAPDGEIEDYLIQVGCPPTICLPIQIQINRD